MTHLSEEELLESYYKELPEGSAHLAECPECSARFAALRESLDAAREYPAPARPGNYGAEVWARLAPQLPAAKERRPWFHWRWALAPVFAALLVVAFFAGRFAERRVAAPNLAGFSEKSRERVMLLSLSDHMERSQIVLAEIENGKPGRTIIDGERERARQLLGTNRLLRQTAIRLGDFADAALLDELERVLLDVANSAPAAPPRDVEQLQKRIEHEGLLFRVRVTSAGSRERGEKL